MSNPQFTALAKYWHKQPTKTVWNTYYSMQLHKHDIDYYHSPVLESVLKYILEKRNVPLGPEQEYDKSMDEQLETV